MFTKSITCFVIAFASAILAIAATQQEYFPPDAFGKGTQHWSALYSKQLIALKESPIYRSANSASGQKFRFLWMRSFHQLVCIRLDIRVDGTSTITFKETSGVGGDEPGHLVINRKRALSVQETEKFLAEVEQSGFWALPGIMIQRTMEEPMVSAGSLKLFEAETTIRRIGGLQPAEACMLSDPPF